MRQLLIDLAPYKGATLADVQAEHYKLERLFELLVMAASDLLFHELTEQEVTPTSYRDAFRLAGVHGLLPVDLADRLQQAAGMRNWTRTATCLFDASHRTTMLRLAVIQPPTHLL